ncbi:hypothetical protein ABIC12_004714 [Pantoea agglomerans]|jgi:hypothetical protein|nr:hypothetical protein [Pantoea agglomerans]
MHVSQIIFFLESAQVVSPGLTGPPACLKWWLTVYLPLQSALRQYSSIPAEFQPIALPPFCNPALGAMNGIHEFVSRTGTDHF